MQAKDKEDLEIYQNEGIRAHICTENDFLRTYHTRCHTDILFKHL